MAFTPVTGFDGNPNTPNTGAIYAPRWIRNSRLSNVTIKHRESDAGANMNGSTVDPQTRKRPSWCSINVIIDAGDRVQSKPQQSFTSYRSSGEPSPQASAKRSNSVSSSSTTASSDNSLYNEFANRLRNSRVDQKNHSSSAGTTNANFESFFPGRTTTESEECKQSGELDERVETNHTFHHRFHWSENIEHCSPWVENRSREIFNHVNGLIEAQNQEILENDSGDDILKTNAVRENDYSASETDDNSITYEVARKFCDTLIKQHENADYTSKCQCSSNAHFKWTKLYEKLIKYGRF